MNAYRAPPRVDTASREKAMITGQDNMSELVILRASVKQTRAALEAVKD